MIHRKRVERDLDDELRSVFEALVNEHIQAGIRPEEARRAATVQLGRIDSIKTQLREERSGAGLESLWHDVRFGARMLRRSPLFTFTAVLSLAIGIGANTTMFSLVNALLLRDLPVADPQQLVEFWRTTQFGAGTAFSYPAYEKLRDENSAFTGVLAMSKSTVAGAGVSGQSAGRFVSGNFFEVLGLTPRAGRLLSAHDDRPDAPEGSAVAVISNRLWQREFGSAVDAIGKSIRVEGIPFTIVGIAPPAFDDLVVGRSADFFIPMWSEPLLRRDSR
ncbi:MAG TPA: ABC transporter permease, partial [Vicinamibacterales bacterium]|nr:ABC transporter permease [Vicinamibacterales bacterium]